MSEGLSPAPRSGRSDASSWPTAEPCCLTRSAIWRRAFRPSYCACSRPAAFERVGGTESLKVDVRIVAATHRAVENEVKKGRFRADLFYRLNVIRIELPPLRERTEDIPLLATHFVQKHGAASGVARTEIASDAMQALLRARVAGQRARAGKRHQGGPGDDRWGGYSPR